MVSSDTTKPKSNTFSRKNEMATSLKRSYYKHSRQRTARNTWSASTRTINLQDESFFLLPDMTIKERMASYEKKYEACMESRTQLSSWIKSNKAKGPPAPLMEDYRPPPRSRLSEFLTTSLSSKNKRSSYRNCPSEPMTVKSSLSTFLKKATNYSLRPSSSSSTSNNDRYKQKVEVTPSKSSINRFSLASSLNRFSLNKNNNKLSGEPKSKIITREQSKLANIGKKHAGTCKNETPGQPKRTIKNQPRKSPQLIDIIPSLSIRSSKVDVELKSIPEEISLQKKAKNRLSIPSILESPSPSPNERSRPQSIIVTDTTSSVFLDRFLSRVPCQEFIDERQKFQTMKPSFSPRLSSTQRTPLMSCSTTILPRSTYYQNNTDEEWSKFLSKTHGPSSSLANSPLVNRDNNKKRLSLLINPNLSMRLSPQKSNFLKRQSMLA
ncbi:hypothetical protein K501DRAFT_266746 [Backusella circina FSU 941]|nr:hypothetical protein K501DRAFT_266746 [Backusella circina FSU 941]